MTDTPAICRTCRWWHQTTLYHGQCRKRAPTDGNKPPVTNSAFWCGEHEAEPAPKDAD